MGRNLDSICATGWRVARPKHFMHAQLIRHRHVRSIINAYVPATGDEIEVVVRNSDQFGIRARLRTLRVKARRVGQRQTFAHTISTLSVRFVISNTTSIALEDASNWK